jgi:HrpA-like RNA helicase
MTPSLSQPSIKLVVMSATLQAGLFGEYFSSTGLPAALRMLPHEVPWRKSGLLK